MDEQIIAWHIVMDTMGGHTLEFVHDIPEGLSKQIDSLINEFHDTEWKESGV